MVDDAMELAESETVKSVLDDGVVDVCKLESDSWAWLPVDNPDEEECSACGHCKSTTGHGKVCLNYPCIEEKRETWQRERKLAAEVEEKKVDAAITKWSVGKAVLLNDDLRLVIRSFMHQIDYDEVDKAFAPWYECDEGFDDEFCDEFINSVPDYELGVVLMRLVVFSEMPAYYPRDTLKEKFPDAAKFYGQTSISDADGVEA